MFKWLFKYGAAIFLFNTILLSLGYKIALGSQIFLVLMCFYALVLLINPKQIRKIIFHKAFSFLLILNIINLSYFLLFHSFSDFEAVKYMLARGVQFSIISFSVYYNFEYYKNKFFEHFVYVIFGVIIISLFINPNIFSGRYSGIFWNPNAMASFSVIGFASLFLLERKKTNFDYFLLFVFLIISLSTGSRSVLLGVSLAFIFKYGFSTRNLVYVVLAIASYLVIVTIQLDTSINRFAEQSLFNDRLLQYQYAYETLMQSPFFGFGLDKYAFINPEIVPVSLTGYIISSHNGYLAILTQYGILFGGIVLLVTFKKSSQLLTYFRNRTGYERIFFFIIIYTLISSVFETYMTGINEFITILFWFSLSILSFSKFQEDYEI